MEAKGQSWVSFSIALHLIFINSVSHWTWSSLVQQSLASELLGPSSLCLPGLIFQTCAAMPHFLCGCWGCKYTYKVLLPAESSRCSPSPCLLTHLHLPLLLGTEAGMPLLRAALLSLIPLCSNTWTLPRGVRWWEDHGKRKAEKPCIGVLSALTVAKEKHLARGTASWHDLSLWNALSFRCKGPAQ